MSAPSPVTLAVVDMGSNSFRLELGRVEGDQIYRLDTWRETLRMGAALDARGHLKRGPQRAALACLARFAERLRGFHPSAVRAVATNTFRVARNAGPFLAAAERTLGFPIDIITGHEEARLIYVGVAHVLPPSEAPRLVIDIGGGSTEFIIGRGLLPQRLESLPIGCVGLTQRFFTKGILSAARFAAATKAARGEIDGIAGTFGNDHWEHAYASSGTALALADILAQNGFSDGGITPDGLARLRKLMVRAGHVKDLALVALKAERAPVLAGGLAVMEAAVRELDVARIEPVGGALRLGVLYDLLGRTVHHDAREATVAQFAERYRIDTAQAERVAATCVRLFADLAPGIDVSCVQELRWAALLHECGTSIAHTAFHKHGAYILQNADMPGFSAREQQRLSYLVIGCRGGLRKMLPALEDAVFRAQILALRLAVLLHHARRPHAVPDLKLRDERGVRLTVPAHWLRANPLTAHLLEREQRDWVSVGLPLRITTR